MGKKSKYEGGSKLVSFRLPAKHLDQAKEEINILLSWYEYGSGRTPEDLKKYFDRLTSSQADRRLFGFPGEEIPTENDHPGELLKKLLHPVTVKDSHSIKK
jgi:hypothetical protein